MPELDEIADWYDAKYSSHQEQAFGRPPEESVHRLGKLNLSSQSQAVLDVGAGQGYFVRALEDAGHRGIGIDIAVQGMKVANRIAPDSVFMVADGQRLPFDDESFDVVTFWGTLEHHPDMVQALTECKRVIRPGGTALFRVPNRRFWVYLIMERLGLPIGTDQSDLVEHLLSLDEWQVLIEQAGFRVRHVEADNWFLVQSLSTVPGFSAKVKMLFRKLSLLLAPLSYTYVFDILCEAPREST